MNKYDFTQTGGFPLDQEVFSLAQDNTDLAAKAALLGGNFCILSGCEIVGANAANGVVVVNGEVLPFVGGVITAKVIINQTVNTLTYQDGQNRGVEKIRYATFGDDGVTNYLWVDFKRNTPSNGLLARVDKIEKILKPLLGYDDPAAPGTTVYGSWLFWGRPAAQIPAGWEPVPDAEWKGRVPVVLDATQVEFDTVGKIGGAKTHTLTPDEFNHRHGIPTGGDNQADMNTNNYLHGQNPDGLQNTLQLPYIGTPDGVIMPHNNLQPYKVVMFIRFVG